MKKEEKTQLIDSLAAQLEKSAHVYLTDISEVNAERSNQLRRMCFRRNVKLMVVKNTLLKKAMEKSGKDFAPLFDILKGHTSIMLSEEGSTPAKLIQEFRQRFNVEKPILKGAYVQESVYIGNHELDSLLNLKSKEQLLGEVIGLLQSPMQRVISGLQGGGHKIAGIVKTLSERE